MRLKESISSVELFKAIDSCAGDVLLRTPEGDVLNLRSKLCRYIFAMAAAEQDFFRDARIDCKDASDYGVLSKFLTD